MRIDEGYFGDVRLDGMKWAGVVVWPGPIHEGHGELQPVLDEASTPEQREALLKIMAGEETEPGATFFQVFASMIDKVREPLFRPIEFEADIARATGRFRVAGLVDSTVEPIRNPVTGAPHFAKLTLRSGFEFTEAEFASSTVKATAPISLDWSGRHAHLAMIHLTGKGIVH